MHVMFQILKKGGAVHRKGKTMLSTSEVLKLSGCNPSTLKRAIARGEITHAEKRKEGNFYNEDDVLAFVSIIKARQLKHSPQSIQKKPKGKAPMKITNESDNRTGEIATADMLNETGLKVKDGIITIMKEMGNYRASDEHMIFVASISYQLWMKYETLAHGFDYTDVKANGEQKEHHYFGVAEDQFDRYLRAIDKLGITPAARLKIKIDPPEEIDPMEELLNSIENK